MPWNPDGTRKTGPLYMKGAFKMKGFPENDPPRNKNLNYDETQRRNINELDDKKSAILERANREGRDLSKSEKAMIERIIRLAMSVQALVIFVVEQVTHRKQLCL